MGKYSWLVLASPKSPMRKSSEFHPIPEIRDAQLVWIKAGVSFQGFGYPRLQNILTLPFSFCCQRGIFLLLWKHSVMSVFSSLSVHSFKSPWKGGSVVGCSQWWTKTELAGSSIRKCSCFELKIYLFQTESASLLGKSNMCVCTGTRGNY